MTTAPTPRTTTAPWTVKLGIWMLLLAIVAGAFALLHAGSPADVPLGAPQSATTLASGEGAVLANGHDQGEHETKDLPADSAELRSYYGPGKKDVIELLPAWRWKGSSGFYENAGAFNVTARLISVFGSFLFLLSGFVWGLLLFLLKFGLTLDLVHTAADAINRGFVGLTSSIFASGIIWVLAILALGLVGRAVMKGQGTKAIGIVMMLVIPVAAMQGLATMAQKGGNPVGSPSWIAQEGVGVLDTVGSGLGSGFGLLGNVSLSTMEDTSGVVPNCRQYNQALYAQYDAMAAGTAGANGRHKVDIDRRVDEAGNRIMPGDNSKEAQALRNQLNFRSERSVATVSYLWERAYLTGWTEAQFGNAPETYRMSCHKLEDTVGVDPYEQHAVADKAGYPVRPTDDGGYKVFTARDEVEHEASMYAWAACRWDADKNEMVVMAAWQAAGQMGEGHCNEWWTKDGLLDDPQPDNAGDIREFAETTDDNIKEVIGTATDRKEPTWEKVSSDTDNAQSRAKAREQLRNVESVMLTYRGNNANIRLINGFLSLVTAVIYFYCLGGIALGAIVAQLGLVLLLILLPATLLLLAIPTKDGSRHPAGRKLIRLTGAFMAAKLVLTVVMVLLLQTIMTFESLIGGAIGRSGVGTTMNGLMHSIIPIAALVLVRMLLKQAGLGDITKLSGSMGMQASAAISAMGDKNGRGGFSKARAGMLGEQLRERGLDKKIDRIDKTMGRGALIADRKTGGRLDLENRAAGIVGRREADVIDPKTGKVLQKGKVLEQGLAGRMRSRAARLGLTATGGVLDGANAMIAAGTGGESPIVGQMRAAVARQHNSLVEAKENSQGQRAKRRAGIQATRGMTRNARLQHVRAMQDREIEAAQAYSQARAQTGGEDADVVWKDGKPLIKQRDRETGAHIFGPNDEHVLAEARMSWTQDEYTALGIATAELYDVKEDQVTVSGYGIAGSVTPQLKGNSDHASIPIAKSEEGTKKIATDVIHYLPDYQKERAKDMSDDEYGVYLHLMRTAAGGFDPNTGRRVDAAVANGIHLNRAEGLEELRKMVRGEDSAFDNIKYEVSADQHQAILSYVRSFRKEGANYQKSERTQLMLQAREVETREIVTETKEKSEKAGQDFNRVQVLNREIQHVAQDFNKAVESYTTKEGIAQTVSPEFVTQVRELAEATKKRSLSTDPGEQATLDHQMGQIRTALEGIKSTHSGSQSSSKALLDYETSQRTFSEMQEKMGQAMQEMLDASQGATESATTAKVAAFEADLSFDLFMVGKNKADSGAVIDKAEKFEIKEFPGIKAAMENAVLQAQSQFMTAIESGNREAIRTAAQTLESVVRKNYNDVASDADRAMRKHRTHMQAVAQEAAEEVMNRKYTVQPGLPRAAEVVGRS